MMRRAFTVIEVIVAMAIFAMAVIPLATGYMNVIMAYDHAKQALQSDHDVQYARAALFAQADPTQAMQGGQFATLDGRQLTWTAEIATTEVADLFTVTFTCQITPPATATQQDTTTVSEVFRLLRPSWSDPAQRTDLQNALRQKITALNAANQPQ